MTLLLQFDASFYRYLTSKFLNILQDYCSNDTIFSRNVNVKFVNHAEVTEYLRIDNAVDSCISWGTFVTK